MGSGVSSNSQSFYELPLNTPQNSPKKIKKQQQEIIEGKGIYEKEDIY